MAGGKQVTRPDWRIVQFSADYFQIQQRGRWFGFWHYRTGRQTLEEAKQRMYELIIAEKRYPCVVSETDTTSAYVIARLNGHK